jgi:GNAT superfamily N-acetyltransferase
MFEIATYPTDAIPSDVAAELGRVGQAVYPPRPPGSPVDPTHEVEWAGSERVAVVSADGVVLGGAGLVMREVDFEGDPVPACGIGGVFTHPDARRRGVAREAIAALLEEARDRGARVGILFCRDELIPLYSRLGWAAFPGSVTVTQHGVPTGFTFNRAMTISLDGTSLDAATLDLHGPPW